ncbi:akirin-2 [Parasteatoda tepidariorum]|uniref:akirin-2 n=1 Tax=Parasteatoda tepidariorum TaxID=114398 RepID=UPI00077F836D|nr:akirin-2 [Parasteatoda tepidariorum]
MACATLKRSCEWDPLQSPTGRSPKRRRCAAVMSPSPKIFKSSSEPQSPFGEVTSKLTSEQIAQNIRDEIKKLHRRKQLRFESSDSSDSSSGISAPTSSSGLMAPTCRDQPLFTYRQVGMICERMIKERENQIRDEYDRILNAKLAEQYDTFVKFTYDQIQKRYENSTPSYLS